MRLRRFVVSIKDHKDDLIANHDVLAIDLEECRAIAELRHCKETWMAPAPEKLTGWMLIHWEAFHMADKRFSIHDIDPQDDGSDAA